MANLKMVLVLVLANAATFGMAVPLEDFAGSYSLERTPLNSGECEAIPFVDIAIDDDAVSVKTDAADFKISRAKARTNATYRYVQFASVRAGTWRLEAIEAL